MITDDGTRAPWHQVGSGNSARLGSAQAGEVETEHMLAPADRPRRTVTFRLRVWPRQAHPLQRGRESIKGCGSEMSPTFTTLPWGDR
jgi:hypothetical protein